MTNWQQWHNVYITDKSGRKMWNTTASPMSTMSEIRNLQQHLTAAAKYPALYPFLDMATAVIMFDGEPYGEPLNMTGDELLRELGEHDHHMTPDEIKSTYADLSPSEAFEAFDAAGMDNATVAVVLGQEVAQEYGSWVYFNLK